MINLLNAAELKDVFAEIEGHENKLRRFNAYKELDIYNQNQEKYILSKIKSLYGADACSQIQAITSINLATRIVNAEASIYKKCPERFFANASDNEKLQIEALYEEMCIDEKLKIANRLYRLGNQCAIQIVPKNGSLKARVLYKHQYDVIPLENDPENAMAYIIPLQSTGFDRQDFYNNSDNYNQKIADVNDADMSKNKYVVWSEQYKLYV